MWISIICLTKTSCFTKHHKIVHFLEEKSCFNWLFWSFIIFIYDCIKFVPIATDSVSSRISFINFKYRKITKRKFTSDLQICILEETMCMDRVMLFVNLSVWRHMHFWEIWPNFLFKCYIFYNSACKYLFISQWSQREVSVWRMLEWI